MSQALRARPIIFRTDRRARRSAKVVTVVIVTGWTLILLLLATVVGVLAGVAGVPSLAAILITISLWALALRGMWRMALSNLRFSIACLEDRVEVGYGLAQRVLSYEDVDMVEAHAPENRHGGESWVRIQWGRSEIDVHLPAGAVDPCAIELKRRCPNAILVDRSGRVTLPFEPRRPIETLLVLERHYRRLAVALSVAFAIDAIAIVGYFSQQAAGVPAAGQFIHEFHGIVAMSTAPMVGWGMLWNWRSFLQVKRRRRTATIDGLVS